jgi:hypothetical protein
MITQALMGGFMAGMMESILADYPDIASAVSASSTGAVGQFVMIPLNIVIYAAFGALGAFLGMKLFFKSRVRK